MSTTMNEAEVISYVRENPECIQRLLTKSDALKFLANHDQSKVSDRFSLFPIRDQISWKYYNLQEANLWNAKEIPVHEDVKSFYSDSMKESYRRLFKKIFGFFAPADGMVSEAITLRYINEAKTYHEKNFFYIQSFIERVHAETYGQFIYAILDQKEIEETCEYIDTLPSMKQKGDFILNYIYEDTSTCHRFLASACAEGVFFVTIFAIIFYFRAKNVLPAFVFANELISKDETLHRDFYCEKVNELPPHEKLSQTEAERIVGEAVRVEQEFVDALLSEPIDSVEEDKELGITSEKLKTYVEMLADEVLVQSGYKPMFHRTVVLGWMQDINMKRKNNFYEKKVSNYKHFSVSDALDYESRLKPKEIVDPIANCDEMDF